MHSYLAEIVTKISGEVFRLKQQVELQLAEGEDCSLSQVHIRRSGQSLVVKLAGGQEVILSIIGIRKSQHRKLAFLAVTAPAGSTVSSVG